MIWRLISMALADFSGANSGTLDTDRGLDGAVQWPQGSLAALGGKTVRLCIHLDQQGDGSPRLFAVSIRATA